MNFNSSKITIKWNESHIKWEKSVDNDIHNRRLQQIQNNENEVRSVSADVEEGVKLNEKAADACSSWEAVPPTCCWEEGPNNDMKLSSELSLTTGMRGKKDRGHQVTLKVIRIGPLYLAFSKFERSFQWYFPYRFYQINSAVEEVLEYLSVDHFTLREACSEMLLEIWT